ncbi:MAG: hypothetical protein ACK45X_00520 [Roseiflexaceae bacterium]|jgi:tRNA nucleotidyltransferase (CCA-adding enzyme)|nr:hypothetical protein [Chloroflexaceae bacterium]MCE2851286.1 hypothetical protein [Chloroflexaceae bacterium]
MHRPYIVWDEIATALPAAQADILIQLATTALTYDATLYIVGGAARSVFQQQPITDLDIAISRTSSEIVTALATAIGGHVTHHDQFATATIHLPQAHALPSIDVVPTRQEQYAHPGALPTVTPADIETDLARRDISVNAIAIAVVPYGHCPVYDPFNGIGDLRRRVARVLHAASFVDDPTRIIRMARMAVRLNLRVSRQSLAAIERAHQSQAMQHVSQHRWIQELTKTMAEPDPGRVVARLQRWRVLATIHPALRMVRTMQYSLAHIPHEMRLAGLLWHATHANLMHCIQTWHELPVSYRQIPTLKQVVATWRRRRVTRPSYIATLLRPFAPTLCASMAMLDPTLAQMQTIWQHAVQHTPPVLITGTDLLATGLTPGPHIGHYLNQLRDALLDGHIDAATQAVQLSWTLANPPTSQLHRQLL